MAGSTILACFHHVSVAVEATGMCSVGLDSPCKSVETDAYKRRDGVNYGHQSILPSIHLVWHAG